VVGERVDAKEPETIAMRDVKTAKVDAERYWTFDPGPIITITGPYGGKPITLTNRSAASFNGSPPINTTGFLVVHDNALYVQIDGPVRHFPSIT
jgi:hypothetical protein